MSTSFDHLKNRYASEALLRQAALRRDHLAYQRLSFGELDEEKQHLLDLLPQAHNAYYLGYFSASISVCGCLLEGCISKFLKTWVSENDLQFKEHYHGEVHTLSEAEDIENLSLSQMLKLFKHYKFLSRELFQLIHQIKSLRNVCVHARVPVFTKDEENYQFVFSFARSEHPELRVAIPHVKDILFEEEPQDRGQIAAWWCLKKTRRIVRELLGKMA